MLKLLVCVHAKYWLRPYNFLCIHFSIVPLYLFIHFLRRRLFVESKGEINDYINHFDNISMNHPNLACWQKRTHVKCDKGFEKKKKLLDCRKNEL